MGLRLESAVPGRPSISLGGTSRMHFEANGNRRGTRGQLVEVPVEGQLAENQKLECRSWKSEVRSQKLEARSQFSANWSFIKDWPWSSWSHYERGEPGLIRIDTLDEEKNPQAAKRKSQTPHP